MINTIKSRGILFFSIVALLVAVLLFCSCGPKKSSPSPTPEPEMPKVSELLVSYDGVAITSDKTISFLRKSDGTLEIKVDNEDLTNISEQDIDWGKLHVSYLVEGSDEETTLENPQQYVKVYYEENGNRTPEQGLPNLNKSGKYYVVISYVKEVEFVVSITKESLVQDINFSFTINQIPGEELSYEFEYGTMTKENYSAMIGDAFLQVYDYAVGRVDEYKTNAGITGDIELSDVDPKLLGFGVGTSAFENLDVGEYYVCVFVSEEDFENTYSNVCFLRITPKQSVNQLGIQKITYTFPVVGAYSNAETTLSSIYENDSNNVAVVVNGENQTMGNGELDGNTGHWEFANKSELVNYVATDGVTVDEANILEPASEVGAGNTKYAVLKFVYDSDNFQDAYFLVKADISRGVVILPDSFWIGLSNNSTEYLTYFSDEQTMNFAYSESINYYASYFDAAPAAMNGLNGVTTFTMKDSSRYRFTESPSLSDKLETLENNYINLSINDESGVCDLSWKLNVLVVNQAKSYEITSVKEMSGDVAVSGDAKVVITSNTSSAIPNINLADMFEYKLGGVAVATEKLETNGNVAKITTTISSFTDDVAEVIANATVKNAFLNKVKINVSMNRLDTLDHTVSINKFEPITQTISNIDEGEYFGVSLNSIKNLPYMKTLNNYYDIVWKIGGTAYQEDIAIGSNVLVADLTPVNSFFVKDFDNENYKYTLSYDEANSQLKFVKQEREIMVSANWDENYTVLSSVSGVVTQIKITITFSSNRPLTLSNMLQVVQDTEIDDENFNPINYAEISSVSYDDDTIEIVVDVKDFLDDGQGNYSSFISIHLTKNVGYDRYVINRMDNFYSIEKNV